MSLKNSVQLKQAPESVYYLTITFRELEIIRQYSDQEGRFVIIDMKIDNKVLTLVNIYAPNKDNPTFSPNLPDHLLSFECEEIIMGGDSNLVMDVQKDKK